MVSANVTEFINSGSARIKAREKLLICIKCGSDQVQREKNDIVCTECGAVIFF